MHKEARQQLQRMRECSTQGTLLEAPSAAYAERYQEGYNRAACQPQAEVAFERKVLELLDGDPVGKRIPIDVHVRGR